VNAHSTKRKTVQTRAVYRHSCSDQNQLFGPAHTAAQACSNRGVSTSQSAIRVKVELAGAPAEVSQSTYDHCKDASVRRRRMEDKLSYPHEVKHICFQHQSTYSVARRTKTNSTRCARTRAR
jgi:hypothetical protein